MTELAWRTAVPDDAAECVELRGKTRENAFTDAQLRVLDLTVESWGDGIRNGLVSRRVCRANGCMVGYCFGDTGSGEIVVLVRFRPTSGLDADGHARRRRHIVDS